jgi:uncharacterized membrane protein
VLVEVGDCTLYCVSAAVSGIVYLIWYLVQGYKLYVHSTARKIHLIFSTLTIACGLNYLMLVVPIKTVATFNFIDLVILIIAVSCLLYFYEEKRRFSFENP